MSNLQTLLDAAKFVECTNTPDIGARAPDPPEFHHYAKTAPMRQRSNSGSDKSDQNDDSRDRKRYGGSGTREVHNILEKNRRAHLKECFDGLKMHVPNLENHNKVSNLSILRGALRYIQALRRKEKELEQELQRLAQAKIESQETVSNLQMQLNNMNIIVDISNFMPPPDEDTRSVSTATAHNNSPIVSDEEDDIEISSPEKQARRYSTIPKPPVNFCNVIVSSAIKPATPATVSVSKSALAGPVFTIKGLTANKSHMQSSTASNNRTIAAMLSTSPQPLINDGAGTTRKNVSSSAMAGSIAVANAVGQAHPVSLIANSLSSLGSSTLSMNTTVAELMSSPVVARTVPDNKASVNQLLQQTIAQRVQLQQLAKLQQQQLTQQGQQPVHAQTAIVVAPTRSVAPNTLNVGQFTDTSQVITMNANALRPVLSGVNTVPQLRPAVALNHVLPSAMALNSANSRLTSTIVTSATKTAVISQPITMAALNRASGMTASTTTTSSQLMPQSATAIINQLGQLTSAANVSMPAITSLQALNLAGVKPILTLPIGQLPSTPLVSQQMSTLQQLMSQAVVKSHQFRGVEASGTVVTVSDSVTTAGISPAVPQGTTASPANIAPIPITQFLPVNIITPAAAQATALGQINLANTTLSSQVLKSLGHIPILQQQILPIKPIVMVTMPNVVTTATAIATPTTPTIQVTIPVTHT